MNQVSEVVGLKRLERLAIFLRALPRKRFDYNRWVGRDWKGSQDLSCGTKACALGWAATIPSFRREGLCLINNSWKDYGELVGEAEVGLRNMKTGRFASSFSMSSGAIFFGIDTSDAMYLFAPNINEDEMTPKQVAKKIEKFVRVRRLQRKRAESGDE